MLEKDCHSRSGGNPGILDTLAAILTLIMSSYLVSKPNSDPPIVGARGDGELTSVGLLPPIPQPLCKSLGTRSIHQPRTPLPHLPPLRVLLPDLGEGSGVRAIGVFVRLPSPSLTPLSRLGRGVGGEGLFLD